jgi:hypothetical protein
MKQMKFFKTAIITAVLSATVSGSAFAHSITHGSLAAPATSVDVFRTTCFTSGGAGLGDGNGSSWTLPYAATETNSNPTDHVTFAISKTGTKAGSVTATFAYADSGNISGPTGDSNNILPATAGSVETASATATNHATAWAGNAEPAWDPITDSINETNWVTGHFQPAGVDGTANGQYVIVISHSGSNAQTYDFIAHCVDVHASDANSALTIDAVHTGQGAGFQNDGTGHIAPTSDYDQVITGAP